MKTNVNMQIPRGMPLGANLGLSRKRKAKRLRTTIMSITLMGVLVVGSIMAYLIDVESKDSKFQFSDSTAIDITLVEENFSTTTTKNVMPNTTYTKDPKVENEGTQDAYVFMQVEVPMANIETIADDGTVESAALTELFSYEVQDGTGASWTQLGEAFEKTVTNGADTEKFMVYTYVYGSDTKCTKLIKDDSTTTLFDEVNVVNYVGGNNINGKQKDIIVTAYAIQTEGLSASTPEGIWSLLATQAGAAVDTDSDSTN